MSKQKSESKWESRIRHCLELEAEAELANEQLVHFKSAMISDMKKEKCLHVTGRTGKAWLVRGETFTWDVDDLYDYFDSVDFKHFCPPTPDRAALRSLLDILKCSALKRRLIQCAKKKHKIELLRVRPLESILEEVRDGKVKARAGRKAGR